MNVHLPPPADRTPRPRAIFFDLDGTLIDPFEGITGSYQYALDALGAPVPDARRLACCIGPPLRRNFERLLKTSDRALVERAVVLYRERYGEIGWRQNVVYPGVLEMLDRLRGSGLHLYLTTAKPEPYATRIATNHGIAERLDGVFGPDLDGHLDDKVRLVAKAIGATSLAARAVLLVGDREQDMRAARENGLPGAGARWGYGSQQELTDAGASWLCDSPAQVLALALHLAS
jgi:phosphoglycolate phosphatase